MTIRQLQTDDDIASAFELMAQLRDRIRRETFVADVQAARAEGYQLIGGFDEQDRMVVLAGLRRTRTLSRGPHIFIDDLVTEKSVQGRGHGTEMLRWIARDAARQNITRIYLDSRDTARGFYEQLGFDFNTSIPSRIEVSKLLG